MKSKLILLVIFVVLCVFTIAEKNVKRNETTEALLFPPHAAAAAAQRTELISAKKDLSVKIVESVKGKNGTARGRKLKNGDH